MWFRRLYRTNQFVLVRAHLGTLRNNKALTLRPVTVWHFDQALGYTWPFVIVITLWRCVYFSNKYRGVCSLYAWHSPTCTNSTVSSTPTRNPTSVNSSFFFIISFFLYIYRPPGCSLEFRFNNLQPSVRVLVTLENIQFRHLINVTVMTSLLTTGNSWPSDRTDEASA